MDTPTHNSPTEAEVARWKARGGIDLSRVEDPDEKFTIASHIRVGVYETGTKFRFRCPICRTVYENDQEMPIMCTGPHPSLDEHVPEITELIRE